MKTSYFFLVLSGFILIQSCTKEQELLVTKVNEPKLPATVYDYYSGDNTRNHIATLGRVLFYDRLLSKNNSVSCGSCHKQAFAFSDNMQFSIGLNNVKTERNSMAIQNLPTGILTAGGIGTGNGLGMNPVDLIAVQGGGFFWDGRESNLRSLFTRPITNHIEMGITDMNEVVEKIKRQPHYSTLFQNAYGTPEVNVTKMADAVATFMESIQSNNSKFDRFLMNSPNPMSAEEQDGYNLFFGTYNCASCHNPFPGPYLTDVPKDIGLENNPVDLGFGGITGKADQMGKFKTPNLKNVALTAPYMHDGRFETLDEVLEHYSTGIKSSVNLDPSLKDQYGNPKKMNITEKDKKSLKAFLNALTDYALVTDVKFSDPFKQ